MYQKKSDIIQIGQIIIDIRYVPAGYDNSMSVDIRTSAATFTFVNQVGNVAPIGQPSANHGGICSSYDHLLANQEAICSFYWSTIGQSGGICSFYWLTIGQSEGICSFY